MISKFLVRRKTSRVVENADESSFGEGQVSDLLRLVVSRGLRLAVGGLLLGTGAALRLTRLMGDLLYQVTPRDPLTFAAAFAVLMLASLAACFMPAWRATRINPVRAFRD